MTTQERVSPNSNNNLYFKCEWNDADNGTYVTVAPVLSRWDRYSVSASASYEENIYADGVHENEWEFSKSVSTSGGYYIRFDSFSTRTYPKRTTAYDVELTLWHSSGTSWSGAYHHFSGTVSFNVTIPALASYTVTYNANGGTGAPESQTKWQDTAIELSATKPTLTNYKFLGWNTQSDGSGTYYQPGESYTANASATLYAIWELALISPSVNLNAYRVETSTVTDTDPYLSGTYIHSTATWSVDLTKDASNEVASIAAYYTENGGSTQTSLSVTGGTSGTSGAVTLGRFEATSDHYFTVTVVVTDTAGATATKSVTVGAVNFPIYVYDKSKVRIHELHTVTPTSRFGEIPGQALPITQVYNLNGLYFENPVFYASADVVVLTLRMVATTACAPNTIVAKVPKVYAPSSAVRAPLFCTDTGFSTYMVGYAQMNEDGEIYVFSPTANVWFGELVWLRSNSGSSLCIVDQPDECVIPTVGSRVTFTVATNDNAPKYQWRVSSDEGATWADTGLTGNRTATLSFNGTAARNRNLYRCRVTFSDKTDEYSDAVGVTVDASVQAQSLGDAPQLLSAGVPTELDANTNTDTEEE